MMMLMYVCYRHQRKTLDMSQMFRYSGLPNNTKLEVVTSSHLHPRKGDLLALQFVW